MDDVAPHLDDHVQPFQVEALGVSGRVVRLGPALAAVIDAHDYPSPVRDLLGQTVALAAALASALKYDGVFTLQMQGDGPAGLMMADVTSAGGIRAYARIDAGRLADDPGAGAPVPALLGSGHMAFTVDQGPQTERYQGITELTGATMADCAHAYFRQSEQLETAIMLAARGDGPAAAGALMIQRLPFSPEQSEEDAAEAWRRAVILMSSLTASELLDPALATDRLLYRLYHQDGIRVTAGRPLFQSCRCTRERVERTLASFPRVEVEDMAENGTVNVTCEFCRKEYLFDEDQVAALYAE